MDEAGLDATKVLTGKTSTAKTVAAIRSQLAARLKSYMARRDAQMFNAGYHAKEPRKIEVKES